MKNLPKKLINEIARQIVQNEIFTSEHVRQGDENLIPSIFMPVLLGGLNDMPQEEREQIGMCYAFYKDSFPRGINGYPMFHSVAFVTKSDAKLVWAKVDKMQKAMDRIMGKQNGNKTGKPTRGDSGDTEKVS